MEFTLEFTQFTAESLPRMGSRAPAHCNNMYMCRSGADAHRMRLFPDPASLRRLRRLALKTQRTVLLPPTPHPLLPCHRWAPSKAGRYRLQEPRVEPAARQEEPSTSWAGCSLGLAHGRSRCRNRSRNRCRCQCRCRGRRESAPRHRALDDLHATGHTRRYTRGRGYGERSPSPRR